MTTYVLTVEAEADLRHIIRYTRKQWSDAQVQHYVGKLERGIANLAAGQGTFKDMSTLFPMLRMAHCEHHYVFACRAKVHLPWLLQFFTNEWIPWLDWQIGSN